MSELYVLFKNLVKILRITIVSILSSLGAIFLILLLLGFSLNGILSHPEYSFVLEEDVLLKIGDQVVGELKAGTIINSPSNEELKYTDLGDPRIYKMYVEFGTYPEMYRKEGNVRYAPHIYKTETEK